MAEKDPTYPVEFFGRLFNLTPRRVQQLASDGVIPKAGHGEYPLLASVQGYVKFLQERVSGDRKEEGWRDERARLAKEQADRVALENARERGVLVYAQHVEDATASACASLSGDLDGLAGRLATTLAGIDDPALVRAELLHETRRIRESFADQLTESAGALRDIESGERDSEAAAESERE